MELTSKALSLFGLERFGRYYSTYVGIVEEVLDRQRLRVRVPEVFANTNRTVIAFPKTVCGDKWGSQNLPLKGEMVWVTFRQGDLRFAIWEGGFFGKTEVPEEFKDPTTRGIITPEGVKVLVKDGVVSVEIPEGSKVNISKDKVEVLAGKVTLGDGQSNQPATKAEDLIEVLSTLINNLIQALYVVNPAQPGTYLMSPTSITALEVLKAQLGKIKADKVELS